MLYVNWSVNMCRVPHPASADRVLNYVLDKPKDDMLLLPVYCRVQKRSKGKNSWGTPSGSGMLPATVSFRLSRPDPRGVKVDGSVAYSQRLHQS